MPSSSERTPGDHHRAKLAAEIGAGAALVGGAAVVGYHALKHRSEDKDTDLSNRIRTWGKRRNEAPNTNYSDNVEKFKKQIAILFNPKLREADQPLLPEAAVRIYIATRSTMAGVATREQLAEQLGVSKHTVSHVVGFLRDNELAYYREPAKVDNNSEPSEDKSPFVVAGFYAGAALTWAIEEGDYLPLQQRYYELMNGVGNSAFADEEF